MPRVPVRIFVEIIPLIAGTMIILYAIQGAYLPTVKASIPVLVDTEYFMQANSVVDIISCQSDRAAVSERFDRHERSRKSDGLFHRWQAEGGISEPMD